VKLNLDLHHEFESLICDDSAIDKKLEAEIPEAETIC